MIEARLREGSLQTADPAAVEITVRAAELKVLDVGLSPARRDEVQARMIGPEVLDTAAYPDIRFQSTAVRPTAPERWTVTGSVTIHGTSRPVTFDVARRDGSYRGSVRIRQHDFGIAPISIAGGTVKVKDEILIEFDIATAP